MQVCVKETQKQTHEMGTLRILNIAVLASGLIKKKKNSIDLKMPIS